VWHSQCLEAIADSCSRVHYSGLGELPWAWEAALLPCITVLYEPGPESIKLCLWGFWRTPGLALFPGTTQIADKNVCFPLFAFSETNL
jgi:hypothetical protein